MSEDIYLSSTPVTSSLISNSPTDGKQMSLPGIDPDTLLSNDKTGTDRTYTITDILRSTDYGLNIFSQEEVVKIKLFDRNGKPYLRDFVSSKDRPAHPEEIVRQLFLYRLMHTYLYPLAA